MKSAPKKSNKKSATKKRASSASRKGSFEARLRDAISAVDVANQLSSPLTNSIENLLRIAAHDVGSDTASVLVRDGTRGGLKFLAALSDVADELKKVRIPPGKGIAGLVFSTGQPMAVADVSKEGSFWSEADKRTGFKTVTLLATPLRTGSEMVGVLARRLAGERLDAADASRDPAVAEPGDKADIARAPHMRAAAELD